MKRVERGAKIRLRHVFVSLDETPATPVLPTVTVLDPGTTKKVDAATPTLAVAGTQQYYHDVLVASTDPVGFWLVEWRDNGIVQPSLSGNEGREIFEVVETMAGIHPARQPVQVQIA